MLQEGMALEKVDRRGIFEEDGTLKNHPYPQ